MLLALEGIGLWELLARGVEQDLQCRRHGGSVAPLSEAGAASSQYAEVNAPTCIHALQPNIFARQQTSMQKS